jgi:hypothetical protein
MNKLGLWRCGLALSAALNVCMFVLVLRVPPRDLTLSVQRWLAAPYVFQTSWRSVFISEYIGRRTVTASQLNSPLVARLLACVGELCFGIQMALALWHRLGPPQDGDMFDRTVPCLCIPCFDLCGQLCATAGTVLRHNGLFLTEGSLWAAMFVLCALSALPRAWSSQVETRDALFWRILLVVSCSSVTYMTTDYCPMCWRAWRHQPPVRTSALLDGMRCAFKGKPCQRWHVWREEWVWQSLYFTTGTWASIWFAAHGTS